MSRDARGKLSEIQGAREAAWEALRVGNPASRFRVSNRTRGVGETARCSIAHRRAKVRGLAPDVQMIRIAKSEIRVEWIAIRDGEVERPAAGQRVGPG